MKAFGRALLLAFVSLPASAQTGAGDIQITCPPGIQVYLDGAFIGTSTFQEDGKYISGVRAGTHTIRLESQGFVAQTWQVYVRPGRPVELRVSELRPAVVATPGWHTDTMSMRPVVGGLVARCVPIRCVWQFLGRSYQNGDRAAFQELSNVPPGSYPIVFRRGDQLLRSTVTITPGATTEVVADFLSNRVVNPRADHEADSVRLRQAFVGTWIPKTGEAFGSRIDVTDNGLMGVRIRPRDRNIGYLIGPSQINGRMLVAGYRAYYSPVRGRYPVVDCTDAITLSDTSDTAAVWQSECVDPDNGRRFTYQASITKAQPAK